MTWRWNWIIAIGLVAAGTACLWYCHEFFSGKAQGERTSQEGKVTRTNPQVEPREMIVENEVTGTGSDADSPIRLRDVTSATGITFEHTSAMSPDRYPPEAMGSGVAMVDFDADGLMDLYFLTETPLPVDFQRAKPRNMSFRACADGSFVDVTDATGLGYNGFSHGVAAGDVDNDGFLDLYLGCYGPNVLFKNNGDGTFSNVAEFASVADPGWGASSAFFDFNEDGNLDLYHCRYTQWTIQTHIYCGGPERSARTYCHPSTMIPQSHILFANNGDWTFSDATLRAGVKREDGRGLGVVAADLNDDGHTDLYIANDTTANFLFMNRGDGIFEDVSESSGAAYNLEGQGEASMGIDAEDVDGDGWPELFVTNFWMEHNTLYKNQQGRWFLDIAMTSGLGTASLAAMGWGTKLIDLDSDGWPDCFVTSGHLDNNLKDVGVHTPYRQRAQLWHNRGNGKYRYLPTEGGPYFSTVHVGRGAAFGDLNNDGFSDIVLNHLDEKPAILLNESQSRPDGTPNHWIRLSLIGVYGNRDAIGAKIDIRAGDLKIRRQMKGGTSYLSAHDPRLLIGLGHHTQVDELVITWPGGGRTEFIDLDVDSGYRLREVPAP